MSKGLGAGNGLPNANMFVALGKDRLEIRCDKGEVMDRAKAMKPKGGSVDQPSVHEY